MSVDPQTLLSARLPHLYAVVDGARDPAALEWLRSAGVPYQCLYAGKKAVELADEAPYLAHLGGDRGPLGELCTHYGEEPTGIFLTSDRTFYEVRRQLRRFLLVEGPDGATMYFRYYDPRIAAVFLPTLDRDQIAIMYGTVVASYVYRAAAPSSDLAATTDEAETMRSPRLVEAVVDPSGDAPRVVVHSLST
ncbi:MAG: DUF4123 domain-containing protein [Myxococcota bacterium]